MSRGGGLEGPAAVLGSFLKAPEPGRRSKRRPGERGEKAAALGRGARRRFEAGVLRAPDRQRAAEQRATFLRDRDTTDATVPGHLRGLHERAAT